MHAAARSAQQLTWRRFVNHARAEGFATPALLAWKLVRAEEEASRRGWWHSWQEEVDAEEGPTGFDEVLLLAEEEGQEEGRAEVLCSAGGIARRDVAIRFAAAQLKLDVLTPGRWGSQA